MIAVTASAARQDLYNLVDRAANDFEIVEITSKKGRVVIVEADEFYSMAETINLMSDPATHEKLKRAIAAHKGGHGQIRELL